MKLPLVIFYKILTTKESPKKMAKVYYLDGKCKEKILFITNPEFACAVVELWNNFKHYIDEDKMSKSFQVLTVCREDLQSYLSKKKIEKIDDGDMENLADKLGESLMNSYWTSLDVLVDDLVKSK